jgi:hypothetical protein
LVESAVVTVAAVVGAFVVAAVVGAFVVVCDIAFVAHYWKPLSKGAILVTAICNVVVAVALLIVAAFFHS